MYLYRDRSFWEVTKWDVLSKYSAQTVTKWISLLRQFADQDIQYLHRKDKTSGAGVNWYPKPHSWKGDITGIGFNSWACLASVLNSNYAVIWTMAHNVMTISCSFVLLNSGRFWVAFWLLNESLSVNIWGFVLQCGWRCLFRKSLLK